MKAVDWLAKDSWSREKSVGGYLCRVMEGTHLREKYV